MTRLTGLVALPELGAAEAREMRARAIFELGKLDPQCGDVDVLCPFALALDRSVWAELARDAESLAAELLKLEMKLLDRPDLHRELGLPERIRRSLRRTPVQEQRPVPWPRVVRFDFHPTPDGWAVSEANSDVPGGFIESSGFPELMAEHHPGFAPCGDPAGEVARALAGLAREGGIVGLVHATAYTDDRQVMHALEKRLAEIDRTALLIAPDQLSFEPDGRGVRSISDGASLDALFRFFPAEWLANLPRATKVGPLMSDGPVPHVNPASALLTQCKRWPLVQTSLGLDMPSWDRLMPEVRGADHRLCADPAWVVKPALGRVGDGVLIGGVTEPREARRIARAVQWFPRHFVAQRRFTAQAIQTPRGPRYPCLGVYTVGGRACGIYGRLAERPLIDSRAQDVAVLLAPEPPAARARFMAPFDVEARHVRGIQHA